MSIIIVGGGMTAFTISRVLSQNSISHVLLCKPPKVGSPRLGESVNLEGTLDCDLLFPEFKHYFYPKQTISVTIGNKQLDMCTNGFNFPKLNALCKVLGYSNFRGLYHIDRVNFDIELYKSVIASPFCKYQNVQIKNMVYSPFSDKIKKIILEDGSEIDCSYIFDATTYMGILPNFVKIRPKILGKKERVVFTHLFPNKTSNKNLIADWLYSTTFGKMHKGVDGICAFYWVIPFGNLYTSIGTVFDSDDYKNLKKQIIIERLLDFLESQGIPVNKYFPKLSKILMFDYNHYYYEKPYGKNWLLAGTACQQTWFPTSSGINLGTWAARLAPKILLNPIQYGKIYQNLTKEYMYRHILYQDVFDNKEKNVDNNALDQLGKRIMSNSVQIIYRFAIANENSSIVKKNFYRFLLLIAKKLTKRLITTKVDVRIHKLQKIQSKGNLRPASFYESQIRKTLESFTLLHPISNINNYLHNDVVIHIDKKIFIGIDVWKTWANELNQRIAKRGCSLDFSIKLKRDGNFWIGTGNFNIIGKKKLLQNNYNSGKVIYEFRGTKIASIFTKKSNYIPIFGKRIIFPFYFYPYLCLKIFIKKKLSHISFISYFCTKTK